MTPRKRKNQNEHMDKPHHVLIKTMSDTSLIKSTFMTGVEYRTVGAFF
jgi:hypothetical protein